MSPEMRRAQRKLWRCQAWTRQQLYLTQKGRITCVSEDIAINRRNVDHFFMRLYLEDQKRAVEVCIRYMEHLNL